MSAKIIPIGCVTKLDLPPDQILERAKGTLETVVILGYTTDGEEYFASSISDGGTVMWLAERMKLQLMNIVDDE